MANQTALTSTINFVPVQGIFTPDAELVTLIGPAGTPFYAQVDPSQSGLNITNSTINSTTIGATTPSTGVFTNISATTGQVSTAPTAATDIANKQYVDYYAAGLSWKMPATAATLANITLSGLQTIDGVSLIAGDTVLVKNQSNAAQNGIYVVSAGAWTYSVGGDTWNEYIGAIIFIVKGNQGGSAWYCTAQPGGTLGVTALNWSNFSVASSYSAGTGLTLTGTVFSITNTAVTAATKGSASKTVTATVNAQGQLTSLTDQDIAIAATQISSGTIDTARISGSYSGITGVGTLTNLTVTNPISGSVTGSAASATTAGSATTATTATNLAGGASGSVPYQTGSGATSFLAAGSNGQFLTLASGTPSWANVPSSMVYPSAGIANSTGSAWGTSYSTTGSGNVVLATGSTQANPTISNYENFTPTAAPTYSEGRVWYDSTEKALSFYNDSSALAVHVAQDLIVKVINNTGSTIANGSPVYITSTSSGQTYPNVALAKADVAATSSVIGLTNGAIANGSIGYVSAQGLIDNVNTSTYTVGQVLYLSPYSAGQLMNTIPPTGITVQVGVVSFVDSSTGKIYVKQTTPLAVPASIITGVLGAANGGTGLSATGTSGNVLTSNGSAWVSQALPASGITVTDDTTTNATRYLTFTSATSGSITGANTSSTKLYYNPSTGQLNATTFVGALSNPTVTNYTETLYSVTGSATLALTNGTVQKVTTSGSTTITLPSSVTGKSFTVIVAYAAADSITWAGGSTIKWAGGVTPTPTSATGKFDIFNFYQDGTNTYGSIFGQNY
jgi:hypothetical protein